MNSYKHKDLNKVGLDPIVNKYKNIIRKIQLQLTIFSKEALIKKNINKKFRIITALSVFYDLKDQIHF